MIPAQDYEFLRQAGVAGIFGPGTPIPVCARQVLEAISSDEDDCDEQGPAGSPPTNVWSTACCARQPRALAQAITLIESTRRDHQARAAGVLEALLPHTGRLDPRGHHRLARVRESRRSSRRWAST